MTYVTFNSRLRVLFVESSVFLNKYFCEKTGKRNGTGWHRINKNSLLLEFGVMATPFVITNWVVTVKVITRGRYNFLLHLSETEIIELIFHLDPMKQRRLNTSEAYKLLSRFESECEKDWSRNSRENNMWW
jgi:hypothetical protein